MFTHLYYILKPYLPWTVRMSLRRIFARQMRRKHKEIWPINEAAGLTPKGWPGWPEGKKFAVVLTHDVEGPEGLAKCRQLAEFEITLGFRSSFNFIPEGTYEVPESLREWLTARGFEVGVHDLAHDGSLFRSRKGFKKKVGQVNRYLKAWDASGFRSGFMLRNLDWIHELDIEYDASTFDTDPFEPQPQGTGTIFPFWIPVLPPSARSRAPFSPSATAEESIALRRGGYFELPYTLPQDSTLFLLLREPSPKIWLKKTEWIAERGGMSLVNVHPDYVRFDGERPSSHTFPVQFYADLLEDIRIRHANSYWHATPKSVARYLSSAFSLSYSS